MEIDLWLHAGFDVVANGSRAHLALARERYGEVLVPICLAVSPPVLRQRLEQRGRETHWKSPSVWIAPRAISPTIA